MTNKSDENATCKSRWRWLSGEEGLAALNGTSFEGAVQTRDIRTVDGLSADVRAPWMNGLLDGGGAALPAVGRLDTVRLHLPAVFEKSPDGSYARDANGSPKLAPPVYAQRMRIASVLLDEQSGVVFALGFALRVSSITESSERLVTEPEAMAIEKTLWNEMGGVFARDGKNPLKFLSMRIGRLGEPLSSPRGAANDPLAMSSLGDLCAAMSPGGFPALVAKAEATEIAKEMKASKPAKSRGPGRI